MTEFVKFPSIEQYKNVVSDIYHYYKYQVNPTIKFIGSVKLHGTNSAVGLSGDQLWVQSRNKIITPTFDNCGFATCVYEKEETYILILEQIRSTINYKSEKTVIFGEWCGGNIQKGMAINGLEKMFVIFAVCVDEMWLNHDQFKDFHDNKNNIYNINQFQKWEINIDFEKPQLSTNMLTELTKQVEKCCPVGKYFGKDGVGEGIVWTAFHNDQRLTFKVKGAQHSVTKVKTVCPVNIEKVNSISEFVDYAATNNRFKQGIYEIFECYNEVPTIKKIGELIRWIIGDIEKEEKMTLEKSDLVMKDVASKICDKVRKQFNLYVP
jgi:hypothetical protein